jgi:hypothetical protein
VDEDGEEENVAEFMFQQPIRIKSTTAAFRLLPNDERSVQALIGILLFNLGLSFHLSAFGDRNDPRNYRGGLQKAVKLYERAFNLQNSVGVVHTCGSAIFFMAILNNLAHAHTMLGNYHLVAESCRSQLLSIMMFLIDTQSAQMPANVRFDRFFRSAYNLIFKGSSHGAAAAA